MKARLNELDGGLDAVDKSPTRKRACTRKSSIQKKGKERRTNTTVSQEKSQQTTRENSPYWYKASKTFRYISRFSRSAHQPLKTSSLETSHQPQPPSSQETNHQPPLPSSLKTSHLPPSSLETGQPSASKQWSSPLDESKQSQYQVTHPGRGNRVAATHAA